MINQGIIMVNLTYWIKSLEPSTQYIHNIDIDKFLNC